LRQGSGGRVYPAPTSQHYIRLFRQLRYACTIVSSCASTPALPVVALVLPPTVLPAPELPTVPCGAAPGPVEPEPIVLEDPVVVPGLPVPDDPLPDIDGEADGLLLPETPAAAIAC
jgi:hypothetical protein